MKNEIKDTIALIKAKNKVKEVEEREEPKEIYTVEFVEKYIKNIISLNPSLKPITDDVIDFGLILYNTTKELPTKDGIINMLNEYLKN